MVGYTALANRSRQDSNPFPRILQHVLIKPWRAEDWDWDVECDGSAQGQGS